MTLTFPTQAERAVTEFQAATKTVALSVIATRAGAAIERESSAIRYVFDDGSSITVRGRGRNHQVTTDLP